MLFDYKLYQDGTLPHFPLRFLQLRLRSFSEGRANRQPKVNFKNVTFNKIVLCLGPFFCKCVGDVSVH